jgi:hypothetical protein
MVGNRSAGEICKDALAAALPEVASLSPVLRLDGDRVRSAPHQKCCCGPIFSPQRLQLPACAIYDTHPVPVIDKNGELGWLAIVVNAGGFQDAERVLPHSVHTSISGDR